MGMKTDDLLLEFVVDAKELLDEIESLVFTIESSYKGSKTLNSEDVNTLFRHFHTIKGNSGFFELSSIVSVSHEVEAILDIFRENTSLFEIENTNIILESCDLIRRLFEIVAENLNDKGLEDDCSKQLKKLKSLSSSLQKRHSSSSLPVSSSENEISKSNLETEQTKNSDASTIINLGENKASKEEEENIENKKPAFALFDEEPESEATPINKAKQNFGLFDEDENIVNSKSDSRLDTTEENKINESSVYSVSETEKKKSAIKSDSASINNATKNLKQTVEKIENIRVKTEKLDSLMDLVGELVIAESLVSQNPDLKGLELENFKKSAQHMHKIVENLQEISMSMRMIPIAGTFQKMRRLVRDLSQKAGKLIDLEINGEETEVDKTVAELIGDPLVHILRNAVDHGIGDEKSRIALGKTKTGKILLDAHHSGSEVLITIRDDGQGLNREKILAKAVSQGLISKEELSERELSNDEVWNFIFTPGFSTAEKVTDISGRGVGMDVVKKNIRKINGKVNIKSWSGKGTEILIRLPLTLAIIEGMVVRTGSVFYIIPTVEVKEVIDLKNVEIHPINDGMRVINIRNSIIPLVKIPELINFNGSNSENTKDSLVIIIEYNRNLLGLVIDEIIGTQSVVIKSLADYLGHINGVSGCTILGNGEISLILDVQYLVNLVNTEKIKESS